MYGSVGTAPSTLCNDCRLSFEPIFNKYGVDVVYSGHAHNIERLTPVNNYTVDPNGLQNRPPRGTYATARQVTTTASTLSSPRSSASPTMPTTQSTAGASLSSTTAPT